MSAERNGAGNAVLRTTGPLVLLVRTNTSFGYAPFGGQPRPELEESKAVSRGAGCCQLMHPLPRLVFQAVCAAVPLDLAGVHYAPVRLVIAALRVTSHPPTRTTPPAVRKHNQK